MEAAVERERIGCQSRFGNLGEQLRQPLLGCLHLVPRLLDSQPRVPFWPPKATNRSIGHRLQERHPSPEVRLYPVRRCTPARGFGSHRSHMLPPSRRTPRPVQTDRPRPLKCNGRQTLASVSVLNGSAPSIRPTLPRREPTLSPTTRANPSVHVSASLCSPSPARPVSTQLTWLLPRVTTEPSSPGRTDTAPPTHRAEDKTAAQASNRPRATDRRPVPRHASGARALRPA